MSFFNKNFFTGLVVGIVLTAVLGFAGIIARGAYLRSTVFSDKAMAARLNPPPLPSTIEPIAEQKEAETPAVPQRALADYNWIVRSLKGEDLNFSSLKGKTVFINFWATWCLPCRVEMTSIQQLYDNLKDTGVVFACISDEDTKTVSDYIKKKGYTFPIYTITGDPPRAFAAEGIPSTFILAPDGTIAFKHVGASNWNDPSVTQFIRGLGDR